MNQLENTSYPKNSKDENRFLICTAITEKWPKQNDNILFLGEWCKKYDNKNSWNHLSYETFPYHWENREKRKLDHIYLNKKYELYLNRLTNFLNEYHKTNHTNIFWRIVIGPWLMFYISSLFDRYEMLRLALTKEPSLDCSELKFDVDTSLAADFESFGKLMASDSWNYDIYQRVLNFFNEINIFNHQINRLGKRSNVINIFKDYKSESVKEKLISFVDKILYKRTQKNKILLFNCYFPIKTLYKLHQFLRLRFSLYSNTFSSNVRKDVDVLIRNTKLKFEHVDQFDHFLLQNILIDMPQTYIESFSQIYGFGIEESFNPQYIVTASSYWNNDVFKIWAARLVDTNQSCLIVLEHGGSLVHVDNVFGHESKISRTYVSWIKPSRWNQIQLPANKYVGKEFKRKAGSKLLVIGTEENRYAYKCSSTPISSLSLIGIDLMIQIIQKLEQSIKNKVCVRPYNNPDGWSSELRIKDAIPNIEFLSKIPFKQIFKDVKFIICTQPQTSYTECMLTGLPTVLVFDKRLYDFEPIIMDLVNKMYKCKMIFYDADEASKHVNAVWNNPNDWWDSQEVKNCRERFFEEAVIYKKDSFSDWLNFFKNLINK